MGNDLSVPDVLDLEHMSENEIGACLVNWA